MKLKNSFNNIYHFGKSFFLFAELFISLFDLNLFAFFSFLSESINLLIFSAFLIFLFMMNLLIIKAIFISIGIAKTRRLIKLVR